MDNGLNMNVAIAGAGLTGLTLAFYLTRAGIPVHIFEKSSRTGGVIQTHRENGFILESGPNTGVLSHPEAMELMEELSDLCDLEIADVAAKARWIWKSGKWEPLPSGLWDGIKTPLFTFSDKLRLLGEPFRKKGENPNETLKELVLRRMGKSFLDYAVDPFILGIYSGDPALLVPKYALPKLYRLEQDYGSFIGGTLKKAKLPKTERDKKATREIFSVKGGLNNLISALTQKTGKDHITLNCENLVFEKKEQNRYVCNFSEDTFTHVVSTTGAYELVKLFPFCDPESLKAINRLNYARVVQVSLGFQEWNGIPLRAFGGLVPFRENRDILGVLFLSSFLKKRAPEKGALLSVFLGGIRKPAMADLPDEQIMQLVEKEITQMLGLPVFQPDLIKIFRYEHAIPQYGVESEGKLRAVEMLENQHSGVILAGNIRDGIGMADRIRQGKMIADKLIAEKA